MLCETLAWKSDRHSRWYRTMRLCPLSRGNAGSQYRRNHCHEHIIKRV